MNVVVRFVVERDDKNGPQIPKNEVQQQIDAHTTGVQRKVAEIQNPWTVGIQEHQNDQFDRRQVDNQRFEEGEKVPFLISIDVSLILGRIDETTVWRINVFL